MCSSHHFVIMSLHAGQKYYPEVYAYYLLDYAISSIDSGKGSGLGLGIGDLTFNY